MLNRFCRKPVGKTLFNVGFKKLYSSQHQSYNSGSYKNSYRTNASRSYSGHTYIIPVATVFLCASYLQLRHISENCGIVGVVGSDEASGYLLEGLTILRNRGYDSAGIASVSEDGELLVTKYASRDTTSDSIDLVRAHSHKHIGNSTGIAHTRWATHGGKTDVNAHPHYDDKKRVAVVHNGTINNSYELRKELQEQGIKFISETDTEVIAQLIGVYLDKGFDVKNAVSHALSRYVCTYTYSIIHTCF